MCAVLSDGALDDLPQVDLRQRAIDGVFTLCGRAPEEGRDSPDPVRQPRTPPVLDDSCALSGVQRRAHAVADRQGRSGQNEQRSHGAADPEEGGKPAVGRGGDHVFYR